MLMPDLAFHVKGAEPVSFAVSPLLVFKIEIVNTNASEQIQSIALRCQVQIETTHRQYKPSEKERLLDLFGEPDRWDRTLRAMLWTHTGTTTPGFRGSVVVDLPVPCTFDFNVAAAKYFAGLEDGEAPLNLMFSGTVFYESAGGALQVEQIPWDREAKYRLPVRIWKEMMDIYYPNTAWLCLRRDVFDRLSQYKMEQGIPTWEQTLEGLIPRRDRLRPEEEEIVIEGGLPS